MNPLIPPGMSRSEFGRRVMQWGTGYPEAIARIATISVEWLLENGINVAMIEAWRGFYELAYERNPANESARGRAGLMRHCLELLNERA